MKKILQFIYFRISLWYSVRRVYLLTWIPFLDDYPQNDGSNENNIKKV